MTKGHRGYDFFKTLKVDVLGLSGRGPVELLALVR